ncbi:MAG: hypothetical protein AB8B57_14600 [Congregibacter sp.]
MQGSLSKTFSTFVFTAGATLGVALTSSPVIADSLTQYEPGFLRQAERALSRGAPQRALDLVEANRDRQLKRQHRAEAHGLVCRAQLKMRAPVEARTACLAAIAAEQGKSNWRFLNNLGVAEMSLGNYDAAEIAFTRAATIGAWNRAPRKNLGTLDSLRAARDDTADEQISMVRR